MIGWLKFVRIMGTETTNHVTTPDSAAQYFSFISEFLKTDARTHSHMVVVFG